MDAGFFKGTSAEQDIRFTDKEKKLLKTLKFPPELDHKVNIKKVQLSVMRPWIAKKVNELLGFEDEVVIEYVNGLLEDSNNPLIDPKRMQLNLTGFLSENTGKFMSELWKLLLSAQENESGIPQEFVDEKKEELKRKREAEEMEARKRQAEIDRQREIDQIRQRERRDRRETRDYDRRGGSSSSRRDDDNNGYSSRRSRRYDTDDRRSRYRSPSESPPRRHRHRRRREYRSRSRSVTPPPPPPRRRRRYSDERDDDRERERDRDYPRRRPSVTRTPSPAPVHEKQHRRQRSQTPITSPPVNDKD